MNKPLLYLAGPYSHKDESVRNERGRQHSLWAGRLLQEGHLIYCPIAETEGIAQVCHMLNTNWETWREKDLKQLSRCDEMWVLMIDGWKDSVGLKGEIKYCIRNQIPISLIDIKDEYIFRISNKDLLTELGVNDEKELND